MRFKTLSIFFILALTTNVNSQEKEPVITLPALIKTQPGRLVKLTVKTNGKYIKWINSDPGKCDLVPFPDGHTLLFTTPYSGKYVIIAYTALGDVPSEPAVCIIQVGAPVPPDPNPPNPPNPDVEPTDSLYTSLKAAWLNENSTDKTKFRDILVSIYKNSAKDIVTSKSINTVDDLYKAMRSVSVALLKDGDFKGVRTVIQTELDKSIPTVITQILDTATRNTIVTIFNKISDYLSRLQ